MNDKCPKCGSPETEPTGSYAYKYACGTGLNFPNAPAFQINQSDFCRIRELERANHRLRDELTRLQEVVCEQDHEAITRVLEETTP